MTQPTQYPTYDHTNEYDTVLRPAIDQVKALAASLGIPSMFVAIPRMTEKEEEVVTTVTDCDIPAKYLSTFVTAYEVIHDDNLRANVVRAINASKIDAVVTALRAALRAGERNDSTNPAPPTIQ